MPPYGLYPIPRHRLYGGPSKLPTFSTAPYLEEYNEKEQERKKAIIADAASAVSRETSQKVSNHNPKSRRKRGRPTNAEIAEREATAAREAASMKPDDVVATAVRRHTSDNSPHTMLKARQNKDKKDARRRKKEESRRRQREGLQRSTILPEDNSECVDSSSNGPGMRNSWLRALECSMNGIGDRFIEHASEPPKKPTKQRKIEAFDAHEHSCKTLDVSTAQTLKKSAERVTGNLTAPADFPSDTNVNPSAFCAITTTPQKNNKNTKNLAFITKGVLVPETPPYESRNLSQDSQAMISPYVLRNSRGTEDSRLRHNTRNSATKISSKVTPVPAPRYPPTQQHSSKVGETGTLPNPRLKDCGASSVDKSRARSTKSLRRATSEMSSAGASFVSSASSSKNLPDYFTRIPKGSIQGNPRGTSPRKRRETHEEAPLTVFNNMFQELRKTVNFTREEEELSRYLEWHHRNDNDDPLPCLGPGSGCTEKREAILRLGKEENVDVLKALGSGGHSSEIPQIAEQGGRAAEELLTLAIRARLPIPIGRIDGTWTLYCPKYARHHFDRYGYGERTLNIATIAGFRDDNNFTARLNIPPRPMTYSILTFAAPPHASFRTIIIKTATEGYNIEVIFFGNGYLQLRVDLNLLLKGKASENIEGQNSMEFIGVHERAVEWLQTSRKSRSGGIKPPSK